MISVEQGQSIVLDHARPSPPRPVPCDGREAGLVLAEDIVSDLDMPPFDKAMMDGFAVRAADLAAGPATLRIVAEIMAGTVPAVALTENVAARIMTGAMVPAGADAVVMVERCEPVGADQVRVPGPVKSGLNIQPRGRELSCGQVVLRSGVLLGAAEVGLLAMVGRTMVQVVPKPRVAVLSTGDELVDPDTMPGPGQIRNSNGPMLAAQARATRSPTQLLGIARDDEAELARHIGDGLQSEVLILSGGVSAGKLDLVPGVLQSAGVVPHFHKIAMKPGKPIFFGTGPRGQLVFGLPGNPVSAFVGFELFVRPAIAKLAGQGVSVWEPQGMPLASDFAYSTDRPTYHPARCDGGAVRPVDWLGSPDLRALTLANALVVFPPGEHVHRAGDRLPTWLLNRP